MDHFYPAAEVQEITRKFSPAVYETLAARSLSPRALADRAKASSLSATLTAVERDPISEDDVYTRNGQVVILGTEGQAAVAFTTRYLVDMDYPDPNVIGDGPFGGEPDWDPFHITLHDPTGRRPDDRYFRMMRVPDDAETLVFPDNATAFVRTFDDNDIVLIYFPVASSTYFDRANPTVPSLGIDSPTRFVGELIEHAPPIFIPP